MLENLIYFKLLNRISEEDPTNQKHDETFGLPMNDGLGFL